MPHFMLTFGDPSRLPVGVVIIEAPSMHEAHVTAVVRRFAAGVPFGESHELSAKMMMSIPPALIGRMMSGAEATQLIIRLAEGRRGRPEK
jgi:glutamate-1-semialdehyde aminotransferase